MSTKTRTIRPQTDAMGWRHYRLPNSPYTLVSMEPPTGRLYLNTGPQFIPVEPDRYRFDGTRKGEREAVARFIADAASPES